MVSYLLGCAIVHVVLFSDKQGETTTESQFSDASLDYHAKNDPRKDAPSKSIQDQLRCDIAIAVAGKIAQCDVFGDNHPDESELEKDRNRANSGVAHIHRALDPDCCYVWDQTRCQFCRNYLESMRTTVKHILTKPLIRDSIKALAAEKFEGLKNCEQRKGAEVEEFFQARGLRAGSEIDSLPKVPDLDQNPREVPSQFLPSS